MSADGKCYLSSSLTRAEREIIYPYRQSPGQWHLLNSHPAELCSGSECAAGHEHAALQDDLPRSRCPGTTARITARIVAYITAETAKLDALRSVTERTRAAKGASRRPYTAVVTGWLIS